MGQQDQQVPEGQQAQSLREVLLHRDHLLGLVRRVALADRLDRAALRVRVVLEYQPRLSGRQTR